MSARTIKIGLLGYGTVGSALHELIQSNRELIRERHGIDLTIGTVLVRDVDKARRRCAIRSGGSCGTPMFTTDAQYVVRNGADIVVEAMGGLQPARSIVSDALAAGKHVITANKKLVAGAYNELSAIAVRSAARLAFEASVCGGVPVVRMLREGLGGQRICRIEGVVNGTCNAILTRMSEHGESCDDALKAAQARGWTEADPSDDLDGIDAAEKIAILAGLAFGESVPVADIPRSGIRHVTPLDIRAARSMHCVIKLVAVADRDVSEALDLRVHPTLVEQGHALARVRDEENALIVHSESTGPLILQGPGAGGPATAGAVLSDVIDVATMPGARSEPGWRMTKPATTHRWTPWFIRLSVPPRHELIDACYRSLRCAGLGVSTLTVTHDHGGPDRRQVMLVTKPCGPNQVRAFVDRFAPQAPGITAPIRISDGRMRPFLGRLTAM